MVEFAKNKIFTYNYLEKAKFIIFSIIILLFITILCLYYYFSLRNMDFFLINIINSIINHILFQIKNTTMLGVLYGSMFGGLFFVIMPIEIVFISFILSGYNPVFLVIIYVLGLFISYNINYYIGMKLRSVSQKIISYKKFYKIKGIVNKYGSYSIFVFNALPLPSQPLSAILGVFRYNIYKFYIFFIAGQIVKYTVISVAYVYFFR